MQATIAAPKASFSIPGPMYIPRSRGTYCGICGMWITLEDEDRAGSYTNPQAWQQNGQWGQSLGQSIVQPNGQQQQGQQQEEDEDEEEPEVQEIVPPRRFGDLPNPAWTCFYRVIIKNSRRPFRQQPQYHLSGIGRYHLWNQESKALSMYNEYRGEPVFTVPWDRDAAVIDVSQLNSAHSSNKSKNKKKIKQTMEKHVHDSKHSSDRNICVYSATFYDKRRSGLYPHGFPIHAHCWTLAERVIGDKAEKELKLLVRIIRQRWVAEGLLEESTSMTAWLKEQTRTTCTDDYTNEFEITRNLIAIRDPIAVQEVTDLIQKSGQEYKPTTISQSRTTTKSSMIVSSLPVDIQFLVLDLLHHRDIRAALDATGWHISASYWRGRLRQFLIFELDAVGPDAHLDWQFLCLEMEQLMEESYGLLNRQRICNALGEIKRRLEFFLSLVETSSAGEQNKSEAIIISSDEEDYYYQEDEEEDAEEDESDWEQPEHWWPEHEQEQEQELPKEPWEEGWDEEE